MADQYQKPGPQDIEVEPRTDLFQRDQIETDWGSVKITRRDEIKYNVIVVTGDYAAKRNDRLIVVNQASGTTTITLPEGRLGKVYIIKMDTPNQVDITGTGTTGKIDNSTTVSLTNQDDWLMVIWETIGWHIISQSSAATAGIYGYAELDDQGTSSTVEQNFGVGSVVNTELADVTWDDTNKRFDINTTGVYECVLYATIASGAVTLLNLLIRIDGTEKNTVTSTSHSSVDPVFRVITWVGSITTGSYVAASIDGVTAVTLEKGSTFHVRKID